MEVSKRTIAEAQACGCPVETTGRPPMTDVGGSAAIYIDPADPEGAADAIALALSERERWRQAGLSNARRFSTETMVDGYLRCYAQQASAQAPSSGQKASALRAESPESRP